MASQTQPPLELRLEPGLEGTVHLMVVAPTSLSLSVASAVANGRKYTVKLQGTQTNLPPDTLCRVLLEAGPPNARKEDKRQSEAGSLPLKVSGSSCTLDVEVDLFSAGMFGEGELALRVIPDFPFASECAVTGRVKYNHPLDVKGARAGTVHLGRLLQLTPARGDPFTKSTLRLTAFHAGASKTFSTFEWPAGRNEAKGWRVGCAESDGTYLLHWLDTRKDVYGFDLRFEVLEETDGQPVAYTVWESAGAVSFPKPKLTSLELGDASATAKVENLAPGFELPLELSLWSHALHDRDGVVQSRVMNPVTRPAEAVASSSEYFWYLAARTEAEQSNVFALLRIPRTLTGTDTYVPVSAVLNYDDSKLLPFDDDQLWLEPPPKGMSAKAVAKQKKTAKELATAVASKELTVSPSRTPHFGAITAGVRDSNLLVSIKLVGDSAYWKDARPTFSVRDADTQAELAPLTARATEQNPRVLEALIPLVDKRILGKRVHLRGAVTVPDAQLWNELCAAPPAFSVPHTCMPNLGELDMDTVKLTDDTSYVRVRCRASHIPNGKNGATLGFRLYELFADMAEPVEMKSVRFRYDLASGTGGQCDSRGRVVARITDEEVLQRLTSQGKYRLEAYVKDKDARVLTYEVGPVTHDFGQTPRKAAGTLIFGMRVPDDFRIKVRAICGLLDINPDYLMACMAFETGREFKASTKNKGGAEAYGLIQFTHIAAKDLKVPLAELKAMTELRQLDYVHEYMQRAKNSRGPLKTLSDVYMAILCPEAVGKPETHVCYRKGTRAYTQNAGLDTAKKGSITKADATAVVLEQYKLGEGLRR